MRVRVYQFNGCSRCFDETLLLAGELEARGVAGAEVERLPASEVGGSDERGQADVAVVTGYLLEEDVPLLRELASSAKRVVAFGSCATTGGPFGMAYQKGYPVQAPSRDSAVAESVQGCLGEIEELAAVVTGQPLGDKSTLCAECKRRSTCKYLDGVVRQLDPNDDDGETCFNDLGLLCNGYVARACKERCVDFNAPCRGCKPMVPRSGLRMLGMFGTLLGNVEVATEASGKGGTDKLADEEDDVTRSVPDVVGNFFRFTLVESGVPPGRIPPDGSLEADAFRGRLLEELPLLAGFMGGRKSISLALSVLEAYEEANGVELSQVTRQLRAKLRALETELLSAIEASDATAYDKASAEIRRLAGNSNLSNLGFGGFRAPVEGVDAPFEEYRHRPVEVVAGTYEKGPVKFTVDEEGVVTQIQLEVL
ncbi:MAG: hypothetical protein Kow0069_16770 [Promethearchaeota archaeon]